jgi:hypothetical protein
LDADSAVTPAAPRRFQAAYVARLRSEDISLDDKIRNSTLTRVSEEAARAASSGLAMVDTAERSLDRDLEASDDARVAASRE